MATTEQIRHRLTSYYHSLMDELELKYQTLIIQLMHQRKAISFEINHEYNRQIQEINQVEWDLAHRKNEESEISHNGINENQSNKIITIDRDSSEEKETSVNAQKGDESNEEYNEETVENIEDNISGPETCTKHSDCEKDTVNAQKPTRTKRNAQNKRYECIYNNCTKSYKNKKDLTAHNKLHTGKGLFRCNKCKKKYVYKSKLVDHNKRIHSKKRAFKCHCGKAFKQKCELVQHQKYHTGKKPYKCQYCKKRFVFKGDLTKHIRIHTGEKPYACDFCKKRFTQSSTRNTHIKSVHSHSK